MKKPNIGGYPLIDKVINKSSPFLLSKEELLPLCPLKSPSNLNSFNKKTVIRNKNQYETIKILLISNKKKSTKKNYSVLKNSR